MPPEEAIKRAKRRSALDRFEKEPIDFHSKIRNSYIQLANKETNRFRIIDSSKDFEGVKSQIVFTITEFLNV